VRRYQWLHVELQTRIEQSLLPGKATSGKPKSMFSTRQTHNSNVFGRHPWNQSSTSWQNPFRKSLLAKRVKIEKGIPLCQIKITLPGKCWLVNELAIPWQFLAATK